MRPSQREVNELRQIKFTRKFTKYGEGSVLVEFGNTQVICTASVVDGVARFLKGENKGWLTAEYSMLPRSTHTRMQRETKKPSGRSQEIQRLIGRSLRAALDLSKLGEYTIHVDCDVIQADGGTRTAAITGGAVALADAVRHMLQNKLIETNPLTHLIASVSVGMYQGNAVVDLDYDEDSNAETDMNLVMNEEGRFIEIQGTAEGNTFTNDELNQMLDLGKKAITEINQLQKQVLGLN